MNEQTNLPDSAIEKRGMHNDVNNEIRMFAIVKDSYGILTLQIYCKSQNATYVKRLLNRDYHINYANSDILKSFGVSNYYGYSAFDFHLIPTFLHFAQFESFNKKTDYIEKTRVVETNENYNLGEVFNKNVELFQQNIREHLKSLCRIEGDEVIEVIEAIPNELFQKIAVKLTKNAQSELNSVSAKKRTKKDEKYTEIADVIEFTFHVHEDNNTITPVVIELRGDLATTFFNNALPSLVELREKRVKLQEWREEGVPLEHCDFDFSTTKNKTEPFEHQWFMYRYGLEYGSFLNLSDMGTGKTYATIMLIKKQIELGNIRKGKIFINAPGMAVYEWANQLDEYAPDLTYEVVNGSFESRMITILSNPDKADILLMNHEGWSMSRDVELNSNNNDNNNTDENVGDSKTETESANITLAMFIDAAKFDLIVIDECHKFKNFSAKRTQQLLNFGNAKYKIGLTGTINANNAYDIYAPLCWINRAESLSSTQVKRDNNTGEIVFRKAQTLFNEFLAHYFDRSGWKHVPKPGTVQELRKALENCGIRYKKSECLDLPEKMFEKIEVVLEHKQAKLYEALKSSIILDLQDFASKGNRLTAMNVLARMKKLQEVVNGWVYDDNHNLAILPKNAKLEALMDFTENINDEDKIVIFSQFIPDMHIITNELKKKYGNNAVACIHGGGRCSDCSSDADPIMRNKLQNKFNDVTSEVRFLVCNSSIAGLGIKLIGATYEIFYSNSFSKTDRSQSMERAHRPGMRESLTIVDIIAKLPNGLSTMDGDVLNAYLSNKSMTAALLDQLGIKINFDDDSGDINDAIKLEQQGKNECFLATIAMLAGKTVEEARIWVKEKLGREIWFPYTQTEATQLMTEWFVKLVEVNDFTNDKKARGTVTVNFPGALGHIVAYVGKMIYDPEFPKPIRRDKWIGKMVDRGGVITKIQREVVN